MDPVTPATSAPAQPTEHTSAQSTTPAAPVDTRTPLERLSVEQRAEWNKTGVYPDLTPPVTDEDDDEPVTPATSATPVQAQTPAKPLSKRQQQINDLIREKTERDLEIARLKGLVEGRTPADTKPQAQATAPVADKEPVLDDFADQPDPWLAYTKALTKYEAKQLLKAEREETARTQQAQQAEQHVQTLFTKYQERETTYKATVPDFDARTLPLRQILDVRYPVDRAIVTSEVAPQLILHLAERPDEVRRIAQLTQTDLPAALREIGKLEAKLDLTAAPAAPAQATPAPKTVTSAPPPPTTLGTRPAEPSDDVTAAVTRGDFSAYRRAADKRELAGRR